MKNFKSPLEKKLLCQSEDDKPGSLLSICRERETLSTPALEMKLNQIEYQEVHARAKINYVNSNGIRN